ncbi:hypothetical protein TEA_023584 [Camellia sinensis var. sinensis]|uniref:Uncharacterized protein n=1 Tax=Camellia sinensis var. sinensis TaxID=542762 RepID=A0A4S4DJG7_CAMSN|nr:hypothetical protein TEA_023584 [Camellia sinensis var. sinensis]
MRRRESIIRQSRADIAQLPMYGHHDNAFARAEQLYNDQCVLSAYGQIDNFFDFLHSNLCNISRQSKLSDEANEVVSSLVFAASRCGELPELRQRRTLFKQRFDDEFERNNVELQLGNSVNSQMKHNLGEKSVPDDMKLQLTCNIAREYTLSLEPPTHEQNFVPQCQQLPTYSFFEKNCETRKKDQYFDLVIQDSDQMPTSKMKDMLWKIGSRFSSTNSKSLVTFPCDSYDSSSNRTTLDSSPPIQDTAIAYLDDMENQLSNKEDFRGKNEINGLDSWDRNVRSKSFVKKSLAQKSNALIKKDAACDGLLRENKVNYQNMIVKGEISMHNSCSSCHDHQEEIEENEESKPRLSYFHPKLPDYDELVATFTEYKKEYVKNNSSNRTFCKCKVNYHNMIVKGEISMHNSCSSCHDHQEETEEDEESNPQLSYVHPKLDYDELVATFTDYKKEYVKNNSSNRTF